MHYILRNEERVSGRIADVVPLRPAYTMALVAEFRRVGRATLLGSLVTGIVQGGVATIGFWIAGVPEPLFFGAATMLAPFVPVVGVLLVIVPTSIGLALTGHVASALIALGWGSCSWSGSRTTSSGRAGYPSALSSEAGRSRIRSQCRARPALPASRRSRGQRDG